MSSRWPARQSGNLVNAIGDGGGFQVGLLCVPWVIQPDCCHLWMDRNRRPQLANVGVVQASEATSAPASSRINIVTMRVSYGLREASDRLHRVREGGVVAEPIDRVPRAVHLERSLAFDVQQAKHGCILTVRCGRPTRFHRCMLKITPGWVDQDTAPELAE